MDDQPITGRCDCGSVRYRAASRTDVCLCFCKQCQRQTSYAVAASQMPVAGFEIIDPNGHLKWYDSSHYAKRGFCQNCGSSMFWQMFDADGNYIRDKINVMVGTMDDTSTLQVEDQIFVEGAQAYHYIHPDKPASRSTD